jgi:uncharacterized protein
MTKAIHKEPVRLHSLEETLCATLFLPETLLPAPALILCHGSGEFKENYFELCEFLSERGVASLAVDMHGHGESEGERFHVEMRQWIADVRAAVDFLSAHSRIDATKIGAFGLSSGGTAILEAALVDSRLKALIVLDGTVRNSLPLTASACLKALVLYGWIKKLVTKRELHLQVTKMCSDFHLASDPEIDQRILSDPRAVEALSSFPLPGAAQAFFVDTIKRVPKITAPTLVVWGEDDQLDPPETARILSDALTCKKQLHIIPGNGHMGHLDRHRNKVFALTADWALQNLA